MGHSDHCRRVRHWHPVCRSVCACHRHDVPRCARVLTNVCHWHNVLCSTCAPCLSSSDLPSNLCVRSCRTQAPSMQTEGNLACKLSSSTGAARPHRRPRLIIPPPATGASAFPVDSAPSYCPAYRMDHRAHPDYLDPSRPDFPGQTPRSLASCASIQTRAAHAIFRPLSQGPADCTPDLRLLQDATTSICKTRRSNFCL
jgi:hypothetical protein